MKYGGLSGLMASMYQPEPSSKLDLTLVPVWCIAISCIGLGAFLSGLEKSGHKFSEKYDRRISTDSDHSCVVLENEDEIDDAEQFTTKQVLGLLI